SQSVIENARRESSSQLLVGPEELLGSRQANKNESAAGSIEQALDPVSGFIGCGAFVVDEVLRLIQDDQFHFEDLEQFDNALELRLGGMAARRCEGIPQGEQNSGCQILLGRRGWNLDPDR